MRLHERIKINDDEYTINELTVEEIIKLLTISNSDNSVDGSNPKKDESSLEEEYLLNILGNVFGTGGYLKTFMSMAMPDADIKKIIKMAPSEIRQIWDALKRVNKDFFEVAQILDLGNLMKGKARELLSSFFDLAVGLSKQVMDQEFSDLATDILSKHS